MQRIAILLVLAGTASADDWPQYLGPTRNGHSAEKGLLDSFPKKGPTILWEKPVGEGYAAPVVAGRKLFIFHRDGNKDVVQCLDAGTGKEAWKFSYDTDYRDRLNKGDGPRATPLVTDRHVLVLSADGRLHCLDRDKGTKIWMRALHDDYRVPDSFFGVATSPVVVGGRVVVNVGGKGAGVVALNLVDGKEAWKSLDDEASYSSPVLAKIGGGNQLVFLTRTGLAILDPVDGQARHQKRWRARIDASVNAAGPIVVGDEVFVSSSYKTGAIVLKVGNKALETLWSGDESLSLHFSSAVHHDGRLYGFHGRQEEGTEFRCVEWKSGKVHWSREGFGCGSIVVADGRLIVMSENGELVLVEPSAKEYTEKSRAAVLDGPVRAHMALADGKLYARDGKKLVCFRFTK